MANVTVIPATRNLHTGIRNDAVAKRKTAGYARVSTDSEEQLTSYEAQVDYYTNYIKSRPEWEFVNVYTDEKLQGDSNSIVNQKAILSKYAKENHFPNTAFFVEIKLA